jgi:hypothetical protein
MFRLSNKKQNKEKLKNRKKLKNYRKNKTLKIQNTSQWASPLGGWFSYPCAEPRIGAVAGGE